MFSTGTVWSKSRLKHCIQPAVSRLEDQYGSGDRIFDRIRDFNLLLTEENYTCEYFNVLMDFLLLNILIHSKLLLYVMYKTN